MEPRLENGFTGYMKYIIWVVGGIAVAMTTYMWANAEVPGGEKRYQQFMRMTMERHNVPGMDSFR